VVFACRDISRTQAAIDRIKEERAHAVCDVIELDLARLHSVRKFAASLKLRYK
jgi:short-subunit dehydrogenase